MSTDTQTSAPQAAPDKNPPAQAIRGDIIIDVRFHPNGLVNMINHRPEHIGAQDWFDLLCRDARSTYQPLAGGRGAFHIKRDAFDRILQENTK